MKKNAYLLGAIALPASYLGLVWLSYWSSDRGWRMPDFLDPNSTEQNVLILVICLLPGLLSFNGWLVGRSLNFNAWWFVTWLIANSIYLVLTVAALWFCSLIIACSFGDGP